MGFLLRPSRFAVSGSPFGFFNGSIGTGSTVSLTDTDVGGATPVAAILLANHQTTTGSSVEADWSIGFTDGTTHRSVGNNSEDAIGTSDTFHIGRTNRVLDVNSDSDLDVFDAAFSSFGVNKLDLTLVSAGSEIVTALLFAEIDAAVAQITTSATANGTVSITGLSFQPSAAIVLSGLGLGFNDTSAVHANLNIGVCDSALNQGSHNARYNDGKGTTQSELLHSQLYVSADPTKDDGAGHGYEITSWNSDGCTITTRNAGESGVLSLLLLGGVSSYVKAQDLTTSLSFTGAGFTPRALLVLGSRVAVGTRATDATSSYRCIGMASDASGSIEQASREYIDIDNVSTTDTDSNYSSTAISTDNGTGSSVSTFDADGVTFGSDNGSILLTLMLG